MSANDGATGLNVSDMSVDYGGVLANSRVSLRVGYDEVVGLIGPNGAGKTSFVDAVTGYTRPSAGSVTLDGSTLADLAPHRRRRAGLARTWQAGELFDDLSIEENVLVAANGFGVSSIFKDVFRRSGRRSTSLDAVDRALAVVGLVADRHVMAKDLPLGKRRLVGAARAIVGGYSVLLLDEPAAGLDSTESAAFANNLRKLVGATAGVLLIDHDISLILSVCDRVYVMEAGVVIFEGSPDQVKSNERVIRAYLGAPTEA